MSARRGLLQKFQGWLAHAAGGGGADYARPSRPGQAPPDAPFTRSDHDEHPSERDVAARERELQVLLATWL